MVKEGLYESQQYDSFNMRFYFNNSLRNQLKS